MMQAWFFLALAIVTEVVGLTVMKLAVADGNMAGYILFYFMVALSYVFLAKAVRRISVGVAYAIWEGSGIALITLITACVFGHVLSGREWIGLAMAFAGMLMVNAGEVQPAPKRHFDKSEGRLDAHA
jgi:spermidine export protein MdtJ